MAFQLAENPKQYYMRYQALNVETLKNYTNWSSQRYDLLKAHAEEKLEEANKEIDNISRGQVVWIFKQPYGNATVSSDE